MPTTSNFGWTTPADTDLVKDGAAAIRTLGNGIDTSFLDLKGGTTGQILSKASNTDLDFTWTSDATGIQATIFDAKGDLIAASAADTAARLASSGVNGDVLQVDTTTATGLKWAAIPSSLEGWTVLNGTSGTALTGAATITVSGISNKAQILIMVKQASSASANSYMGIRLNTDTGTNYLGTGAQITANAVPSNIEDYSAITSSTAGQDFIYLGRMGNTAGARVSGSTKITGAKSTTNAKGYISLGSGDNVSTAIGYLQQGLYIGTSAITSISVFSSVGNFDAGTVWVFGSDN